MVSPVVRALTRLVDAKSAKESAAKWATRAGFVVGSYIYSCVSYSISQAVVRHRRSSFLRDDVIKQEVSKLYDEVLKKESSSGSLIETVDGKS